MAKINPLETDISYVSKLDDEPNDIGGLTAQELKETFDRAGNTLKEYINRVVVDAINTMKAGEVAFEPSQEVPADTVQAAVESVRDQMKEAVLGQIPDNSVGPDKLTAAVLERSYTREQADNAVNSAVGRRARVVTGTYVGTGTYGENNPCTLTFDARPMLVAVYEENMGNLFGHEYESSGPSNTMLALRGAAQATRYAQLYYGSGAYYTVDHFTWGDTFFRWFSTKNSGTSSDTGKHQLNEKGVTYHYLALVQEVTG